MDKNLSIEEIIENEIMNNLRVKLVANYWGILHLKVLYKDKLVCNESFDR